MKWLIFLTIFPHLKPASLEYLWPMIAAIFDVGRVVSAVIIIFLFILKKKTPSAPVWVLTTMETIICVSTFVNNGDFFRSVILAVSCVAVVAIIDFFSAYPGAFINGLMLNLEWMIYVNLASIILTYPNGMYIRNSYVGACYFLGYHNGFFQYVLLAIVVCLLYMRNSQKKLRPLLLMGAGYACIIITWSATSVMALMLLTGILLLPIQIRRAWITFPNIFL